MKVSSKSKTKSKPIYAAKHNPMDSIWYAILEDGVR